MVIDRFCCYRLIMTLYRFPFQAARPLRAEFRGPKGGAEALHGSAGEVCGFGSP